VLAELYPQCFTAERWQPHRPLKIGVHLDLIARGVLLPDECRALFLRYCFRLMYQRALAAGGPRFDLDGNIAGEVTPDQIEHALAAVASVEAKILAKTEAARKQKAARRQKAARKAAKEMAGEHQPASRTPPPLPSDSAPRRFSLADLKAAAAARRNGGPS
jgi:sRNA-binding protein